MIKRILLAIVAMLTAALLARGPVLAQDNPDNPAIGNDNGDTGQVEPTPAPNDDDQQAAPDDSFNDNDQATDANDNNDNNDNQTDSDSPDSSNQAGSDSDSNN